MSSAAPTPESIREALKAVKYPGFSRDIVSFGLVQEIAVTEAAVKVRVAITTADPKVPKAVKDAVDAVVQALAAGRATQVEVAVAAPKSAPQAGGPAGSGGQQKRAAIPGVKHIVAVASGKGGVGKSTFSTNLACAFERILSARGRHDGVGVLDCDIYGPSIPIMMGVAERPEIVNEKIIPPQNFGIKVMSMALLVDENAPVVWRGPMINNAITQFAQHVEWAPLEVLVVDLPPGTGDAQLSLCQTFPLDGAVIVTTPQAVAVSVTCRGARMFGKVNVPLLGVAENMSWIEGAEGKRVYVFGEGGGARAAAELETNLLGQVPLDPEIRQGCDRGIPIVVAYPDSPSSAAFMAIAQQLLAKIGL